MPLPMHGFRFNHAYALLLLVCAALAFIPSRLIDPVRAQFQGIYSPVERPALALAQWIKRFDRGRPPDAAAPEAPRSDSDIRQENLELRDLVAGLTNQLRKLEEREAAREKLGSLRDLCTPYPVTAGDSGSSESLLISGTNLGDLKAGMAALYTGGLAGQLQRPGLTGTRVRLVTDRGFSITGVFARYIKRTNGKTELTILSNIDQQLVRGEGNNMLLIQDMKRDQAQLLRVNDWLLLDDDSPDWPAAVQGQLIGRVIDAPIPSRQSPGFAEVRLEPAVRLMQLRELMIVDKAK